MAKLFIYCDGGSRGNPGPAASAFVVKDLDEQLLFRQGEYIGITTNNQAEYQAVQLALNWTKDHAKDDELVFYLDSQLVVNQILGKFRIKEQGLLEKAEQIKKTISANNLNVKTFLYVPRRVNFEADSLVNETLDANVF